MATQDDAQCHRRHVHCLLAKKPWPNILKEQMLLRLKLTTPHECLRIVDWHASIGIATIHVSHGIVGRHSFRGVIGRHGYLGIVGKLRQDACPGIIRRSAGTAVSASSASTAGFRKGPILGNLNADDHPTGHPHAHIHGCVVIFEGHGSLAIVGNRGCVGLTRHRQQARLPSAWHHRWARLAL